MQNNSEIQNKINLAFEKNGVLNPACYQEGDFVHIFYRAVNTKNESSIGYAKLKGPTEIVEKKDIALINRDYSYEKKGVEDPRVVKIGETFYMTYVAYDGKNALTAYAESEDLRIWNKMGIISPLVSYYSVISQFEKEKLKDRYSMFGALYTSLFGKDVLVWFKDVILFFTN